MKSSFPDRLTLTALGQGCTSPQTSRLKPRCRTLSEAKKPMTDILPITTNVAPEEIGEIAERRLRASPYFFLKMLRCDFEGGVLTLRGHVPYRQLKQFAESIVSRVNGVEEVVNYVEVLDPFAVPIGVPAARNAG
jgi:hypothetical protein